MTVTVFYEEGKTETYKNATYWDSDDNFIYVHVAGQVIMISNALIEKAVIG